MAIEATKDKSHEGVNVYNQTYVKPISLEQSQQSINASVVGGDKEMSEEDKRTKSIGIKMDDE